MGSGSGKLSDGKVSKEVLENIILVLNHNGLNASASIMEEYLPKIIYNQKVVNEIKSRIKIEKVHPHEIVCNGHCCSTYHQIPLETVFNEVLGDLTQ